MNKLRREKTNKPSTVSNLSRASASPAYYPLHHAAVASSQQNFCMYTHRVIIRSFLMHHVIIKNAVAILLKKIFRVFSFWWPS